MTRVPTVPNKNNKRILIVTACSSLGDRFKAMLDDNNYGVDHCGDCETALKLMKAQPYAMAVMNKDGQDPDIIITGSKLKQIRPRLKILIVSGYAHRSALKEAQASGIVDAFELKTARNEELLSVIANMLASKEKSIKKTINPVITTEQTRPQTNPNNSLLNDLEQRHPGILSGSWSAANKFAVKRGR